MNCSSTSRKGAGTQKSSVAQNEPLTVVRTSKHASSIQTAAADERAMPTETLNSTSVYFKGNENLEQVSGQLKKQNQQIQ